MTYRLLKAEKSIMVGIIIRQTNSEIRYILAAKHLKLKPFKCFQCDFTALIKYVLNIHIDVSLKLILTYIILKI